MGAPLLGRWRTPAQTHKKYNRVETLNSFLCLVHSRAIDTMAGRARADRAPEEMDGMG